MKKVILALLLGISSLGANATSSKPVCDTLYVSVPAIIKINTDSIFNIRTRCVNNFKINKRIENHKIYFTSPNVTENDTVFICVNTPNKVIIKPGRDYTLARK